MVAQAQQGPAPEDLSIEPGEGSANFDYAPRGLLQKTQGFLHQHPTAVPLFVLLATIVFFSSLVGPRFFAPFNLSLIIQQVTVVGVLGVAQTLVILTAGIDLSVGAIMLLSSVIMGRLCVMWGLPAELGIALGILSGMACGLANGMLVARMKLPPFIVTLGTWSVFGALVLLTSQSQTIRSQDVTLAAPLLQALGTPVRFPGDVVLTYGSFVLLGLTVLVWYILHRTPFGRHLHATGDDPSAAQFAGINTSRTLIATYALAGTICGIAGWVLIGRIGSVSPFGSETYNLDSVTAVVIGGTSLFGGRGSILGTLIGALIVGVFRNGLALGGVDVLWQEFSIGALIIVAVVVDQWIRRISS